MFTTLWQVGSGTSRKRVPCEGAEEMNFEGVLITSNGTFRIGKQLHVVETRERDLNEVPVS
jgi:hypothetical protein